MLIRREHSEDVAAIAALVEAAFETDAEARLVEALRNDGDLVLSLVAEVDGVIVGHVGLSRLASPQRAVALAPLAVGRGSQHRGIGAALVRSALSAARGAGATMVFVLGNPGYYGRFGFAAGIAEDFPSPYSGPYHLAIRLDDGRAEPAPVVYAAAFANLGSR